MMISSRGALVSACVLLTTMAEAPAGEQKTLEAPCVVDAYLRAHAQTMQADAGPASVDAVIKLVDKQVVYEHPGMGIRIETADSYRQGLEAFLGATDDGHYEVRDYMVNGNTVSISLDRVFKSQADGDWLEKSISQMMVFEVNDGKIARIIDYW